MAAAIKTRDVYRPRDPKATSFLMSRVRSTDTKMEVKLRKALHLSGYRYRKNFKGVLGRPDIAFTRSKVAVFIDGDFWHSRILAEGGPKALRDSLKTGNHRFWIEKLSRNVARDRAVTAVLIANGWLVVRIWESELKKDLDSCFERIVAVLESRKLKPSRQLADS